MQTAETALTASLASTPSKLVFDLCHQAARDLTNFPEMRDEVLEASVLIQVRTAALAAYYEEAAQFMAAVFSACPLPQPEVQERLLQLSQQLGLALAASGAAAAAAVASMQSAQQSAAPQ